MTADRFKLPRSSYDELQKIIIAYGKQADATLVDITSISGIHKAVVSANNAFLVAVEIVGGGNKKSTTEKGATLARALEHSIENEIKRAWKQIVEESDFLSKMALAVSIRKGMERAQLESHIAYTAGEAKSKAVATGARTIIDILIKSGIVAEDGDQIVPVDKENDAMEPDTLVTSDVTVSQEGSHPKALTTQMHISAGNLPPTGVTLHIEVQIQAKPSDLDGLGEKLKSFLGSLSNSDEKSEG